MVPLSGLFYVTGGCKNKVFGLSGKMHTIIPGNEEIASGGQKKNQQKDIKHIMLYISLL